MDWWCFHESVDHLPGYTVTHRHTGAGYAFCLSREQAERLVVVLDVVLRGSFSSHHDLERRAAEDSEALTLLNAAHGLWRDYDGILYGFWRPRRDDAELLALREAKCQAEWRWLDGIGVEVTLEEYRRACGLGEAGDLLTATIAGAKVREWRRGR